MEPCGINKWSISLWTKLWQGLRLDIPLRENCKDILQTLPSESKLFLAVLMDRCREEVFARPRVACHVPCNVILTPVKKNHIEHNNCNWSLAWLIFNSHYHSPQSIRLLYRSDRAKGEVVETITLESFKFSMVVLISIISPSIIPDKYNSNSFQLTFPTIIALTSQVRKPMWQFF